MLSKTFHKRLRSAAVLAAVLTVPGNSIMAGPLAKPVAVEISFLEQIEQSQDWLAGAMAGLGAPTGYSFTADGLTISDTNALVAANRIKAFYLETRLQGPEPWLLLPMTRDDGAPVECVTPHAIQMIPSLEHTDFGRSFATSILRTDTPEACLIDPATEDPFARKGRGELRQYFDEAGDLKQEHRAIKSDLHFIRALIKAGFYVHVQGASGNLRVN